jgi:hypothetical protein
LKDRVLPRNRQRGSHGAIGASLPETASHHVTEAIMKKILSFLLVLLLGLAILPAAYALDPPQLPKPVVGVPTAPVPVRPSQADLSVTGIYANSCKCDLADVNAVYLGGITVRFARANVSLAPTEPSAVVGTLAVSWQDAAGTAQNRTVMLQNSNFSPAGAGEVRVVTDPILARKSVGVTAELRLNPAYAATDPNPANNMKRTDRCEVYLH